MYAGDMLLLVYIIKGVKMLKDFVGKKVEVIMAFGMNIPHTIAQKQFFDGVLTECDENYLTLDGNVVLSTKWIVAVTLVD